jgi:diguanylate cyclase (GGDEF)-like protein
MDAAVIVAIVVGVLAFAAIAVAVALSGRARALDNALTASTSERDRLESELDTLARLFAEQSEQLAEMRDTPPVQLTRVDPHSDDSAKSADELAEEVFDAPSGLLRERFVAVVLQQKVAASRRKITPLSVLAIELDRLRTASRAAIDDGMKVLGDVLRATLRESDAACRLGDVLAISVLEDTDQHGALLAAERVRSALKTVSTDALTVSVGIACYPAHALDAPELVTRAGEALGIAKAGGWDRVATAAPPDAG